MNGLNQSSTTTARLAEQLPADSSGIINMSSPSGSSDSGSSGMIFPDLRTLYANFPSPGMGTTAKSTTALSKVQSQSSPLAAKSPVMSPSPPKKSPSSVACSGGGAITEESRQKTDLFLSQFQAQMSQMKSAMDELLMHKSNSRGSSASPAPIPAPVVVSGGKPRAIAARISKRAATNTGGAAAVPAPGSAAVTYQSQISTSNGLKMKIKKSPKMYKKRGPKGGKRGRKKRKDDDDDMDDFSDFDDEPPRAKVARSNASKVANDGREPIGWGDNLPENVLENIFSHGISDEGCIPFLVRVSKVSRLWRKVASNPKMWTHVDLSTARVKDVYRSERNLVYFLENRFFHAKHLNLGGWSSALTNGAIDVLVRCCKDLESLGVSSCQKLTGPNLKTITESCKCLQRLDLSAISTTYNTKSAASPAALIDAAEAMGSRMTHLSLANNCVASCTQIVQSLSDHCPNLEVLDLSNVTSPRRDTIAINVEHLQQGCPLVRILRLTNSDIMLSETTLKEQVSSPGFPKLEELSIAVDPKKCSGMDDGDLERIVKNAKKLRLLDVRGCGKISDSGLVRVPAWDLEHLYLSGCYATKSSNDGLELIVRKWRHSFKEIDFSWTPNEDAINLAISALAEQDSDSQLPPVKVLDLCGSSVSLESIKRALKTCVFLLSLNLTSCRALPRGMKRNYQSVEDVIVLREQVMSGKFDDNTND
ncbi:F-box/LRR-repeat protein 6 [Orchesella cincta]|uniref:F-box/LRR-repeat protein 6 n=1 Tax=Orchesella cincta TaxID=48709 RepID=A0A1D2NMN1_ORCCI|nr:F-box/LRR-repeat protein 6 [Orchesella cincta]